ncbi:MAG: hypothetical protein JO219_07120 [Candidatus Eremiobacteraeota bacterium]|nr:hypothetical protein [Candidatus Eremiobacteraeota bacterium]MBV8365523.1 hypothetical protein [Candidatus Eremiobacteraeota bacterium]
MRDTTPVRETNNGATIFGIVAVVVIAALIILFAWRPWANPSTTTNNSSTTVTQPTSAQPTSGYGNNPAPAHT